MTGIRNLLTKSLNSTNKVNIAYATIEALRSLVPRDEWTTTKNKAGKKAKVAVGVETEEETK
jgi:small subunit ribosomal protein S5